MKTPQYINGKDIYVSKVGEALRIGKKGEPSKIIPIANTSYLVIVGRVQVSTQALWYLAKMGIHVHFYLYRGDYVGSYYPREYCSDTIRKAQYKSYFNQKKRKHVARAILESQRKTRLNIVRQYGYRTKGLKQYCEKLEKNIPTCNIRELFGYEGNCSKIYYAALSKVCKIPITKREFNPAKDEWNCLMSWGHALLYNEIMYYLWDSGLDPFLGFLHEMRGEQLALAYDLSELWKPLIEKWIVTLCNTSKIKPYHFSKKPDGAYMLNTPGKMEFDKDWESFMRVLHDDLSIRNSIYHEIIKLKKFFMGEEYSPGIYS